MSEQLEASSDQSSSSIMTNQHSPEMRRILDNIEGQGLNSHLLELELQGFTVIPGVLSEDRVNQAKEVILRRVEKQTGKKIDPATATEADFNGEKSAIFHSANAGKRMLTVDPTTPEGREVILDLVRWADVVAESFSPKTMKAFGLDYHTLREVNPNIIMLSTCLMGQTGPLSMFAGYGNLAAAITGFYEITGWSDREPAGPFGAYTDYVAPRFIAVAVLAALDHRRRTGEGQHIDLAQSEASLHFLSPAILDYTANKHIQSRIGNRDPHMAPDGPT